MRVFARTQGGSRLTSESGADEQLPDLDLAMETRSAIRFSNSRRVDNRARSRDSCRRITARSNRLRRHDKWLNTLDRVRKKKRQKGHPSCWRPIERERSQRSE